MIDLVIFVCEKKRSGVPPISSKLITPELPHPVYL